MLGIFEWIDETQTLRSVLERELAEIHPNYNLADSNPAFKHYNNTLKSTCRNSK